MQLLARWRNPLAIVFLALALFVSSPRANGSICMAPLNWSYQSDDHFSCFTDSLSIASSGPLGTACPVGCFYECYSNWEPENDLYRPNNCQETDPDVYDTGYPVECYCDPTPAPDLW